MPTPSYDELSDAPAYDELSDTPVAETLPPMPVYGDESGIPTNMDPRQRKRLEIASEMAAARGEGEKLQAAEADLERQYRSIERFTPSGILNQPERFARAFAAPNAPEIPERFQPGQPIFPIHEPKGTNVAAGFSQLGVQLLNSLQTPEMIVTAPAAATPVGRLLFAADMGRHIPEQVEQAAQVIGDIGATPAEKVVAGGQPVITSTMTGLLGKSPAPIPDPILRAIAKGDAAGLNRATQALTDTVRREADLVVEERLPPLRQTPFDTSGMTPAELLRHEKFVEEFFGEKPIEVESVKTVETPIKKEIQNAESPLEKPVEIKSVEESITTQEQPIPPEPTRAQGGEAAEVLLKPEDAPPAPEKLPNRNPLVQVMGPDGKKHWFTVDGTQDFTGVDIAGKDRGVQRQLTAVDKVPVPEGQDPLPAGGTTYQYRIEEAGYKLPELPSDAEIKTYREQQKAKTQTQPGVGGTGGEAARDISGLPEERLQVVQSGAETKVVQPLPEPAAAKPIRGEQSAPVGEIAAKAQPELAGTKLGAAESKLAEVVNQSIEQAPSAARPGISPAATMRPMDVVLGAPDLRSISPAVEARWQVAVKGTESIIDKVKENANEAWKSVTREYADLPPREFPREIDTLRRLRASRNASARTTVDVLKGITHDLGPKQYGVFNRVALLEDLIKDVEAGKYADGRDLPFGYQNAGELTADLNKFRSVSEATPQIKAALERRQEFMDSLRSTLVERGFLPESIMEDPRYFHHQVLLYMAEKNAPTGSRSFRDWFSGWQKKRTGSSKDYNRQYVEAEAEVLSDAFNKIAMQDLQGEMRGIADLTAELKELHGAEWQEHIPKTHTLWQPKRGNAFYPVQTVAERVMDRYLSGLGDILPSEFKEALAMGGRKQEWVVPKPLAKVLDNIAPRPDNWIGHLATAAQNGWKKYILLNPLRAAKYNLNNLSGDLDFLFAAQPKIFKEFKGAASDMWGFHVKGKSAVGDIKEAMQDGVIGSGWRASELPDIARSDYFNWLTGDKPKLVDRYWDWIGKRSDAREDTGRLASYRFAKKEWEADRPFYGASVPADVNALATPRLKAAKVAREILIDYGRGTEFSNFTRQKLVPFFKWMEGNFVRYQQLIKNIPEQEGAGPRVAGVAGKKAATLAARMAAAYGIVNIWNHMFFPREEEELGEGRNQLHLILGRDDQGNIQTIRFQGALSDLLGWVGLENLPQDVGDLATGKADVGDKMEDAYEAGISRAVNASLPFPKTAAEIGLGRSFYPNALQPRPVRDKAEHAAGLFSLKPVYQWLAGKPHKPLRKELASLITYTTDPGEAAYNTTRHMAGEWLEEQGEERNNVIPGKRSNALHYYKQALRYKDQGMAQKFLDEYNRLGGKREGLTQSIKASAPLSMLGNNRKAFLDSLSPQEQEAVRRAEQWYRRVYAQPPTRNQNP